MSSIFVEEISCFFVSFWIFQKSSWKKMNKQRFMTTVDKPHVVKNCPQFAWMTLNNFSLIFIPLYITCLAILKFKNLIAVNFFHHDKLEKKKNAKVASKQVIFWLVSNTTFFTQLNLFQRYKNVKKKKFDQHSIF